MGCRLWFIHPDRLQKFGKINHTAAVELCAPTWSNLIAEKLMLFEWKNAAERAAYWSAVRKTWCQRGRGREARLPTSVPTLHPHLSLACFWLELWRLSRRIFSGVCIWKFLLFRWVVHIWFCFMYTAVYARLWSCDRITVTMTDEMGFLDSDFNQNTRFSSRRLLWKRIYA